jgi:hypothetical protein
MQAKQACFRPEFSLFERENLPFWSCFPILERENCRLKTGEVCQKCQESKGTPYMSRGLNDIFNMGT